MEAFQVSINKQNKESTQIGPFSSEKDAIHKIIEYIIDCDLLCLINIDMDDEYFVQYMHEPLCRTMKEYKDDIWRDRTFDSVKQKFMKYVKPLIQTMEELEHMCSIFSDSYVNGEWNMELDIITEREMEIYIPVIEKMVVHQPCVTNNKIIAITSIVEYLVKNKCIDVHSLKNVLDDELFEDDQEDPLFRIVYDNKDVIWKHRRYAEQQFVKYVMMIVKTEEDLENLSSMFGDSYYNQNWSWKINSHRV